jgi:hypothetical protein
MHVMRQLLLAMCLTVALACSEDSTSPRVTSVELRAPADSLVFGKSMRFVAIATGDSAIVAAPRFAWTSSDTNIAVVDSLGTVIAISPGAVTITADFGGYSDRLSLRIVVHRSDGGVQFTALSRGLARPLCAIAVSGAPYCDSPGSIEPGIFTPLPGNAGRRFSSFSVSEDSQCGLTDQYQMICWGRNNHWHFGNGLPDRLTGSDTAVLGANGREFLALSVGGHSHSCGVNRADSVVYCFGHGDLRQLGRSTFLDDSVPRPIEGSIRGLVVTAADTRSCVVDVGGQLVCWPVQPLSLPGLVTAPEPMASVASGRQQTCAVAVARSVYCWGRNDSGELGLGSSAPTATPTRIAGNETFSDVFPGIDHTCALRTDGALFCWGSFHPRVVSSRLGNGRLAPRPILPTLRFVSVAADDRRMCGVATDRKLYCWQ